MLQGVAGFMSCHGCSSHTVAGVDVAAQVNCLLQRIVVVGEFTLHALVITSYSIHYTKLYEDITGMIESDPNVTTVIPRLEAFALAAVGSRTQGVMVIGMDPDKEDKGFNIRNRMVKYKLTPDAVESLKAENLPGRTGKLLDVFLNRITSYNVCYTKLLRCFRNAETALTANLAREGITKPAAVVLDIDETVLDNSPFQGWQVIENKAFNYTDWSRWVEMARAEPLPGAVEFTRYADSLGVEVFFV